MFSGHSSGIFLLCVFNYIEFFVGRKKRNLLTIKTISGTKYDCDYNVTSSLNASLKLFLCKKRSHPKQIAIGFVFRGGKEDKREESMVSFFWLMYKNAMVCFSGNHKASTFYHNHIKIFILLSEQERERERRGSL